MATKTKTVEFWFPQLNTAADAVDTNFTQITVYLPESSKVFRSVILHVAYQDINTTLSGTNNRRQVSLRLAAVAYSVVNNTNVYTLSGEQFASEASGNFTSYFTTNWTGTSMTCDARFLYDMSTATPLGANNLSACLTITYDYDDTSATQIKTVRIPLNAPVAALGTIKPGATASIPNLSTYLPEASKTIKQTAFVVQGNESQGGATVDMTLTWQVDTDAVYTSQIFEAGGASDRWFRLATVGSFTTNASHSWFIWASVAKFYHLQAWLVVTYEYNEASTTSVFNSLILPMEINSPMGGAIAADYQRGTRDFFIEEPATITGLEIAFYVFWDQAAAISTLQFRIGTGSFVTYTDLASVLCGGNGAMIRNDAAFSLVRGRNTLNADCWRSDTVNLGFNLSGFWIVNYTSAKATGGTGAHNHSIIWNLSPYGTNAAVNLNTIAATNPTIAETSYYLTAIGTALKYISNTNSSAAGVTVLVERLAAEGGLIWEAAYVDIGHTDPESGIRHCFSQVKDLFKRWPSDVGADRMDLETARRWRTAYGNGIVAFDHLDLIYTIHSITKTISGTVSGSGGGTVTLSLHRVTTGEKVLETSRVGNGSYSFTWYDDTEQMYVEAREGATFLGRSDNGLAT